MNFMSYILFRFYYIKLDTSVEIEIYRNSISTLSSSKSSGFYRNVNGFQCTTSRKAEIYSIEFSSENPFEIRQYSLCLNRAKAFDREWHAGEILFLFDFFRFHLDFSPYFHLDFFLSTKFHSPMLFYL